MIFYVGLVIPLAALFSPYLPFDRVGLAGLSFGLLLVGVTENAIHYKVFDQSYGKSQVNVIWGRRPTNLSKILNGLGLVVMVGSLFYIVTFLI